MLFDGVHIILLLGICNLLVFSPSLQSIYLARTNERRGGAGARPMRSQGLVSCLLLEAGPSPSLRAEQPACPPPAKNHPHY